IPYSYTSPLCTSSIGHTDSPTSTQSVNPTPSHPTAASSSSSTPREEGHRRDESRKPRAALQEEQARVLAASLLHVVCIFFSKFIFLSVKFQSFMCVLGVGAAEVRLDGGSDDCWFKRCWCVSFHCWVFLQERSCSC